MCQKKPYDIALIGGGLGALLCAYILSKKGYHVIVLEQNAQCGGCLQVFKRGSVLYDIGMHYLGGLEEGQNLYYFFRYFDLFRHVSLQKLDEGAYERIFLGGHEFKIAMGYDRFLETLSADFPQEREGLRNYLAGIRQIADASPLYNLRERPKSWLLDPAYLTTSVNAFIESRVRDPLLQNVLAGTNLLYAGVKDQTPVYLHALIQNSFLQNTYRVSNGGQTIARALVASIERFGGEIQTGSRVTEIVCDARQATAVVLESGQRIEARRFISAIHPQRTLRMLDTPLVRRVYRSRIESLENTMGCFTLYVEFKPECQRYQNYNTFCHDSLSAWEGAHYTAATWPRNFLFMHQACDPQGRWAQSAEVIAYMHYDDVKAWEQTLTGHRGKEYEAFKRGCAEKILTRLEQRFPGFRESVARYEAATPLTYRDFTGTEKGALYGVQRQCQNPIHTSVMQKSTVPNLFFTGQNTQAHGFMGVAMGSLMTCAELMDLETLIEDIKKA